MSNEIKNNISPDTLSTEYVSPETCIFYKNKNGFLGVKLRGTDYARVILTRALPLKAPCDYICISDVDKNEIGIIEHSSAFPADQQKLIDEELSIRYFTPTITKITDIQDKMGHFYFDTETEGIKKSFTVRDPSKNIRQQGASISITDVDGNRYRIEDIGKISSKSRRKIEPYLY